MNKQVIIVGAGISGLTAGIYAQRSGFDVTIIEQHSIPGGMCTSWRRGGYLFEGAIHWLTGSNPKNALNGLWRDTGALSDNVKVFYNEPFSSVEWEGKTVCLYRDMEKTRAHLTEVSPADTDAINQLVKDIQTISKIQMPIMDIKGVKSENPKKMGLGGLLKMLPAMPLLSKTSKMSAGEYANRFEHPALRRVVQVVQPYYYAGAMLFTLATLAQGDGGYPEGGSLAMVMRMANTFKSLGGKLMLGTKVKKIVVINGTAEGVELENEILRADAVIVTQETIAAIDQLFAQPPKDAWLTDLRENTKPVTCTFVGVGIRAEISESSIFTLPQPIICGGISYSELFINNYSGFKGYAPEGGTALTIPFLDDTYDFWKKAMEDGRYALEKQALAEQISLALSAKFPQAEGKIEVIDVATPLTYERYTGASRGSWMSVMNKGDKQKQYPGFLESVKSVYFAGHRLIQPGGLPVALVTGRNAAQMVCRQFDMRFK